MLWVLLRCDGGLGKRPQVKETGARIKEEGAWVCFPWGAQGGWLGQQRGLLVTEARVARRVRREQTPTAER